MARHGATQAKRKPSILIVDDHLEQAEARCLSFTGIANAMARTPSDVTLRDLQRADVVLVDFVLDRWEVDESRAIAERPKDGVALAAVFRSHTNWESPTAFALHSGQLGGLSGGLPPESHLHAIAKMNNVEWVFSKVEGENSRPMEEQVVTLARAVRLLPGSWPTKQPARMRAILQTLLGLRKAAWEDRAWQDVENCHPPIHELSPPTHAITFLRWLLSSILPYATFLWDFRYLAARLHVAPSSLSNALTKDRALARRLSPFKYNGVLNDFLGDRWWRAGIEHHLWELTRADPFDADALKKVARQLSRRLEPLELREPVVEYNSALRPTGRLIELTSAIELQPDDWPAFASRPWAERENALAEIRLRSLVPPVPGG